MFQATAADAMERLPATGTNTTRPLQRALHPHAQANASRRGFGVEQRDRQRPTELQSMMGNQAMLRMLSPSRPAIQTKLVVNQPGDRFEQEADRVADKVMRTTPAATVQRSCSHCDDENKVQRKCAACEEEDKIHRQPNSSGPASTVPSVVPSLVQGVLRSPGRPLDPATRAFMEPRFGYDFSDVRVQTGAKATDSARSIQAHAYTYGNQIVFTEDAYKPDTNSGRHLIAHELAHTLQQKSRPASLQRATDFDIRGVNPDTASAPSTIFFDLGGSVVPASETGKITAAALPAARSLTLNGYSSEDGTPSQNVPIINARIEAVRTALQAAGHTGPMVPNPQPNTGVGQLDYRSVRAVEIVPAGLAPSTPQCQVTTANPHPENEPCGSAFSSAQPVATVKVANALSAITVGSPAATAQLNTIFPGVPAANIVAKLSSLQAQLIVMTRAGGLQCHNSCDGACARPGFMSGQGASAVMTLCPYFLHTMAADDRVEMLMHEGMHATSGAPVEDQSYRSQRLIGVLSGSQAATNTDSFINLILLLQPGAVSPLAGGPPVDHPAAMTSTEASAAERALAYLEKWVEVAEWDTSQLYEAIKRNIGRAGGWNPADDYHAKTQHAIGGLLRLTDPGNVTPFLVAPLHEDQVKVAGIHDRYNRMNGAVDGQQITMTKGATEAWAPGPGSNFVVKADFFGIGPGDQVIRLLTLLAASMPDIPTALQAAYANAANQIRWHKGGIGP